MSAVSVRHGIATARSQGSHCDQSSNGSSSALPISSETKPEQSTNRSPSMRFAVLQDRRFDVAALAVAVDVDDPAFGARGAEPFGERAQVGREQGRVELIGIVEGRGELVRIGRRKGEAVRAAPPCRRSNIARDRRTATPSCFIRSQY